jgi:hypothetical protein
MTSTFTRKIGSNRGAARLWLEGPCLANHGWTKGTAFTASFDPGTLTYSLVREGQAPAGPVRKVAGTADRPIIDTNTDKLTACLDVHVGASVTVTVSRESITVTRAS